MSQEPKRVLILGGAEQAYRLAESIENDSGWRCVTSLAGRTRNPKRPAGELAIGGFGGAKGLSEYILERGFSAMIDATHPFAEQISRNAVVAGDHTSIPVLRLERPPWPVMPHWHHVSSIEEAVRFFRDRELRIFLTIGRREADAFRAAASSYFLVRMIDPPDEPLKLKHHQLLFGRGPFSVENERRIMCEHRIEWLVTKNSGGESGRAKLDAAEEEGVKICIIQRPSLPECECVETIEEAAAWLNRL